jgi:iron complex outermembrane receptor protein
MMLNLSVGVNARICFAICLIASAPDTTSAIAQTVQERSTSLPAVTVEAPKQRPQSRAAANPGRATRTAHRATRAPAHGTETTAGNETSAGKGTFQQGNGPIQGYVAHSSLVGTKTNTPLLEVPQAISVVGRDQIRDQGAQTAVQALGYTAGVATNNDPNDTRFDSLLIRGFAPVLYLDGMQMPFGASGRAAPKLDMSLLERIEVLKGPSSSLYGQIPPGGMINLVSKLPSTTPVNSVELTADSWGLVRHEVRHWRLRCQGSFGIPDHRIVA